MALSCALTNCATEELSLLKDSHHCASIDFLYKITAHLTPFSRLKATGRLMFGIILKTGTIPLQQTWKNIWWRLFFRDTEPWRDACFKRVLAIELSRNSRYWQFPKSLINSTENTEKNNGSSNTQKVRYLSNYNRRKVRKCRYSFRHSIQGGTSTCRVFWKNIVTLSGYGH